MKKEEDKFIEYCGITAKDSSLRKIKAKLDIINYFYKEKTDNLKLEDIHSFLSWVNKSNYAKSTKNDIIKVFKRFLKWKYKDWNTRFNELKDAKCNGNDGRQLDKEDLLTSDEMNLIISATDSIKYKTILLLMQETACRPEEILRNLKWKNVNWNKGEVKLYSNKTDKTRFIPIKNSMGHLQRYKVECFPTPPRNEEMVFGLSNQALSDHLNKIEKKLKLTKHLYGYLYRHSILSKMIRILSPKIYELFAGHALETGMKIYAHLDTEDLREELNEKVYHIKELTPEEKNEIKELNKRVGEMEKKNVIIVKELADFKMWLPIFMPSKKHIAKQDEKGNLTQKNYP